MARSSTDLPRMQNQAKPKAPLDKPPLDKPPLDRPALDRPPGLQVVAPVAEPRTSQRPQMMRQYDLVERVKKYNPTTDEDILNRAYVYAMKAHGEQKRASGDPYFSH